MIQKIAIKVTEVLLRHRIIEEEDREIYSYGLELILSNIINLLTLLILTIVLGTYIESIVFLVFLIPIRLYAGGYHAKTYLRCNLVFIIIYLMIIGGVYATPKENMLIVGSMVMCMSAIIIYRFAPVESEYNPLSKDETACYAKVSKGIIGIEVIIVIMGFIFKRQYTELAYVGCLTTLAVAMSMIISILQRRNNDENQRKSIS